MFHWRSTYFPSKSVQELADASEARALKEWLAAREIESELRRAVIEAARAADAVARLDHALRYLR